MNTTQKRPNQLTNHSFLSFKNTIFLFIGIGLLVYFNGMFGSFVLDDISQIQNNFVIKSLANFPNFFLGSTFAPTAGINPIGNYYKPLFSLFLSILYTLFGTNTFFFHFFQLSLHISNVILLFVVFTKFLDKKLALFLSLTFLVHSMNSEAVVYISALQEPLFFFFGMVALLISLTQNSTNKKLFFTCFFLLLSILSKETGILFFILVPLGQLLLKQNKKNFFTTLLTIIIPFFVYCFLRFGIAHNAIHTVDSPIAHATFLDRLLTAPVIIFFYIKTFLFPSILVVYNNFVITSVGLQFYFAIFADALFFIGVFLAGFWIYKKAKKSFPLYLFFTSWFALGIGMHLQFIPLDFTASSRWFYFSMAGILGMIGIVLQNVHISKEKLKLFIEIVAIIVLVTLSIRTILQNVNWYNEIAITSYDYSNDKIDVVNKIHLAAALINAGKYKIAESILNDLLTSDPQNAPSYLISLGTAYQLQGRIQNAKETFSQALHTSRAPDAYYELAMISLQHDKNVPVAKSFAEKGITSFPKNDQLWMMLAYTNYKLGNIQEAITQAAKAVQLLPSTENQQLYLQMLHHEEL